MFGAFVTAPRVALRDVLLVAGAVLAAQSYDESVFRQRDDALAAGLITAGHGMVRINLEHNATPLPRPLLTLDQLRRLALHAAQAPERTGGNSQYQFDDFAQEAARQLIRDAACRSRC